MKIHTGAIINLDAKPAPGIVVEASHKGFRAYFPGVNGEEPEVLEFEHRNEMDSDELNILVSRIYQSELTGSTIPEGGEFFLDWDRAVFALVRVFRVVSFSV